MYTDIPEWGDYLRGWGLALLTLLAVLGIIGGLVYILRSAA